MQARLPLNSIIMGSIRLQAPFLPLHRRYLRDIKRGSKRRARLRLAPDRVIAKVPH